MWHLARKPYQVQREALKRAEGHRGWQHHLDMGLGKTAVVFNEYADALHRNHADTMVVFCPNSLKGNWESEAKECALPVPFVHWPAWPKNEPVIWTINYEGLLTAAAVKLKQYFAQRRVFLVADETTRIKNFKGKTAKQAIILSGFAKKVRGLSGRMMVQNVMDLWAQLRFLGALDGVNPYVFRNTYAVMGGYLGKQVVGIKREKREDLRRLLDHWSFRARSEDWLDLPAKIYPEPRRLEMLPQQAELYKKMEIEFYAKFKDSEVSAPMVITQMLKLQQITSGFLIDDAHQAIDLMPPAKNPRINEVLAVIEESGHKCLIFTYYQHSTEMLEQALTTHKLHPLVMRGGMGPEAIEHVKTLFNTETRYRALICQISVGKMGHTLLGVTDGESYDRCNLVQFFENSYSLDDREQAEKRPHRIGQTSPVTYVDFAMSRTDLKAIRALQKKLDVSNAVLSNQPVENVT